MGMLGYTLARGSETRPLTPSQSEGPYYPLNPPADAGNNLIEASGTVAEGTPLELSGQVMDRNGQALPGITVEIWQCDNRSIYRHPRAPGQGTGDPHFAGFGRTVADAQGRYRFMTIVPVAYPGRPPHIHVKLRSAGQSLLTTQIYLAEWPGNQRDVLLRMLGDRGRQRLMMSLEDAPERYGRPSRVARFDLVV